MLCNSYLYSRSFSLSPSCSCQAAPHANQMELQLLSLSKSFSSFPLSLKSATYPMIPTFMTLHPVHFLFFFSFFFTTAVKKCLQCMFFGGKLNSMPCRTSETSQVTVLQHNLQLAQFSHSCHRKTWNVTEIQKSSEEPS